jgi:hypothetical protein
MLGKHARSLRSILHASLFWRLQVIIVTEVDRVHAVLHPLLRRDLEKQGGRLVRASHARVL